MVDDNENKLAQKQPQISKRKAPIKFSMTEKDGKKELLVKANPAEDLEGGMYRKSLQNLTGTNDFEIASEIVNRGAQSMPKTYGDDHNHNVIVQSIAEFNPQNAEEARLCAQAAVLYSRGMRYLSLAEGSIQKMSDAGMFEIEGLIGSHNNQTQFAIKLLRLHNETLEVLSRLKRGNDQRITVQHQYVQVNDGGQAIVGQMGVGGNEKNDEVIP